jgi:hypothetical protein
MVIDIQRTVIKTQLRRFLTLIAFMIVAAAIILIGSLMENFLGITKYRWALIVAGIYIISIIIEALFELNYIYFSDEDDLIVLRYFSMSMFNRQKNSIEIPKKVFRGYQIEKSFFGLKKKIVLLQRLKDRDVKYPAVSVTGLNANEFQLLIKTLDKYK